MKEYDPTQHEQDSDRLPDYDPVQLEQEFKELSFDESPQFRDGETNELSVERQYGFNFNEQADVGNLDAMWMKLGFHAVRVVFKAEGQDQDDEIEYNFKIYCQANRAIINGDEMNLPLEDWQRLDEDYAIVDDDSDMSDNQLVTAVRTALFDRGVKVDRYMNLEYNFSTIDHGLILDEYSGYEIDDQYFGVAGREDFYGTEFSDPVEVESPLEDHFIEVASDLRDEIEDNGDLLSPAQKQSEVKVLLDSIAKRRLRGI